MWLRFSPFFGEFYKHTSHISGFPVLSNSSNLTAALLLIQVFFVFLLLLFPLVRENEGHKTSLKVYSPEWVSAMLKRPAHGFPRLPKAEESVSVIGRRKLFFQMRVHVKLLNCSMKLLQMFFFNFKFNFQNISVLIYYNTRFFFYFQGYFLSEIKWFKKKNKVC